MEKCLGSTFIFNNTLHNTEEFNSYQKLKGFSIYEIIRIESAIPLFLEDHLQRLYHSLELEKLQINEGEKDFSKHFDCLISNNEYSIGKIKLIINFFNFPENQEYNILLFFTEYSFPTEEQYSNGVPTILCQAIRNDPNAKVLDTEARNIADRRIVEESVYEALLVNPNGYITEGSRSNFFGIKNNTLYTPPDDTVLQGIARKKVLEICDENNIEVQINPIHKDELNNFQSVFITGTSPKILPVNQIDKINFSVDHELLGYLMVKYDEKLNKYLKERQ